MISNPQYLALSLLAMCEVPRFGRYISDPWKKGGNGRTYNKSPNDTTKSRRAKRKRQRDARSK